LKKLIFEEIRKIHEESSNLDDSELNKLFFHTPDSLRLSLSGFVIVKNIFKVYSFTIPENIKSKHYKSLSKFEYPYFLTSKKLILFSELDATCITLQGGVENFLEIFALD
jgi:hypothetical protein